MLHTLPNNSGPRTSPVDIPALSAVLAVTVFAFLFAIEQVYNYDIWWHLKSGEWILENRKILRFDPFSWSTAGEPWQNMAWLSGVFFVLLEHLGGINLLIVFKALAIGLGFGGACLFLIRRGVNPWLAAFVLGYTVVVARFRFLLRPTLFMFPFTVALLWLLGCHADRKSKTAFFLFPLTVLWVNLHGSGYLAPVFASFLLGEKSVAWIFGRFIDKKSPLPLFELLLTLLLFLALLISPFGMDIVIRVFRTAIMEDLVTRSYGVAEHLPLQWGSHNLFWILLFATGLSCILNLRKTRLLYLLMFLSMNWIALSSQRYVGIAAFVMGILLALNMQVVLEKKFSLFKTSLRRFFHCAVPVLLLVLAVFAFQKTFTREKVYTWGLGINESRYPVKALEYLKKTGFTGNIYNSWQDGGFILWHSPGIRTSIDGRCMDAQLKFYTWLASLSGHELQKYLDENNVKAALLIKEEKDLNSFFQISPRFRLTWFDASHALYLRDDMVPTSPAQNTPFAFQYIKPQNFDFSYLREYAAGPDAGAVEKEFDRAVALYPDNFSLVLQQAVFLDLRNRPAAVDAYLRAARLNPSLGFSHFNLGLNGGRAALKHQRWSQGVEILQQALANGKKDAEIFFLLGTAYFRMKKFERAEEAYTESIQIKPDNPVTLMNLGYVYLDTRRYQQAAENFQEAVRLMPGLEGARYGYVLALQRSGDPKAETARKDFMARFPESRWTRKLKVKSEK